MEITRRSFLAGLGSVTVGLLFRRQLDAVLSSLERDLAGELASEQISPDQTPCGADIVVQTVSEFRPRRLVVPKDVGPNFVIENITIGPVKQFAGPTSALAFDPRAPEGAMVNFDEMAGGSVMTFRVHYIGNNPLGERFVASIVGLDADGRTRILPISSEIPLRAYVSATARRASAM